ncbi:hypothetical protein U0070_018854 [Myodes glareolus]|uniref:N-terminal Ras-GEF domain-containing protein n=1 Tax=Myodes glareolus TaxID=447135 RepID=A0AAW0JW71_MYOGA
MAAMYPGPELSCRDSISAGVVQLSVPEDRAVSSVLEEAGHHLVQLSNTTFSSAFSDNGLDSDDEEPIESVFNNGSWVEVEVNIHCSWGQGEGEITAPASGSKASSRCCTHGVEGPSARGSLRFVEAQTTRPRKVEATVEGVEVEKGSAPEDPKESSRGDPKEFTPKDLKEFCSKPLDEVMDNLVTSLQNGDHNSLIVFLCTYPAFTTIQQMLHVLFRRAYQFPKRITLVLGEAPWRQTILETGRQKPLL